jgi:hypothetical protein
VEFVFVCPNRLESFYSADFLITENRGVACDAAGNRYLDARVQLTSPCPLCGESHDFAAKDLVCPFGGNNT